MRITVIATCLLLTVTCVAQQAPPQTPPGLQKLEQAVDNLTAAVNALQPKPSPGAGILPGQTGLIAAFPAGQFGFPTTMPANFAPVWSTSDPVNCPLIAPANDANSSQMLVSVPLSLVPTAGQTCVLTVTSPDGTGASHIVIPFTAPAQGSFPTAILSYQVAPSVITGYYVYQIQYTPPVGAVALKRS